MKKGSKIITKRDIQRSVSASSALEGQSFARAKKNTGVINLLKRHGRAFSV